jgi:hypothetical protein
MSLHDCATAIWQPIALAGQQLSNRLAVAPMSRVSRPNNTTTFTPTSKRSGRWAFGPSVTGRRIGDSPNPPSLYWSSPASAMTAA